MARSSFNNYRHLTPAEPQTEINNATNSAQQSFQQTTSLNNDYRRSDTILRALRTDWSAHTEDIQASHLSSTELTEKFNKALAGTNKNLKQFMTQHGFMLDDQTLIKHALDIVKQPGSVYKLSYLLGAMRRMPSADQLQALGFAAANDPALLDFISSLEKTRVIFSKMSENTNAENTAPLLLQYKASVSDDHLTWICQHVTQNQWVHKAGEEWEGFTAISFFADLGQSGLLGQAILNLPVQLEDLRKVRTENGFVLLLKESNYRNTDMSLRINELAIRAVMFDSKRAIKFLKLVNYAVLKNDGKFSASATPYRSPLHAAIASGNENMVSWLIKQGAVPTGFDLLHAEHASPEIKEHVRRAFDAWDSQIDKAFS